MGKEEIANLIRKEQFNIKPFKHIRIGDPMYFEEMEAGSNNKYLKDITCDFKTSCCKTGSIVIEENNIQIDNLNYNMIDVKVFLAKDENQLNTYLDNKWFGEKTVKKCYDLGCDTARFEIEVDGRYNLFHTGADGYYGEMKQMKQYFGLILYLSFDAELMTFDKVKETMSYLFDFKTENKKGEN